MGQPLILTLQIDDAAQAFYEDLRRRYFPPERNVISAHLTLFHQLPEEERTYDVVHDVAARAAVFQLENPSVRSIGRGMAVFFDSANLISLHAHIVEGFEADLTAQDRQRLRPHIVVQNKVDAVTAKRTLLELSTLSVVRPLALGFSLWRYLGGPWERLRDFPFSVRAGTSI